MTTPILRRRLKAALALRGQSIRSWSIAQGYSEAEVWHQISGRREYAHILLAIADVLGENVGAVRDEIATMVEAGT